MKYLLHGLAVGLFLWGTVVIACRVSGGVPYSVLGTVGAALVVSAAGIAFWLARQRTPDDKKLSAVIDCESQKGGIFMALHELAPAEPGLWSDALRNVSLPKLRWKAKQTLLFLFAGMTFAVVSLVVPENTIHAMAGPQKMDITKQVREIEAKLETLQDEKILDVEKVDAIKQELKRLQQNAEGLGPVKTWDALDHLNDQLAKEAQKAAEELLKEQEKLANAESLAEAMKEQFSEEQPQKPTKEEMQELANEMNEMLNNSPSMENDQEIEDLKKQVAEQGLESLTQEQLEKLAEKLSQKCQDCQNRLNNLKDARMIDPGKLKDASDGKMDGNQKLEDFLKDQQCKGACQGDGECDGNGLDGNDGDGDNPGRGGINRGPGHARLNYNHETNESNVGQKEHALETEFMNIENSVKLGVSKSVPTPNKAGSLDEEGGAVQDTSGVAGSSGHDVVLPKHRGTVKRFFDSGGR